MKHITIRDITLCALFCALTAVGAFISIPLPYGAVTLQWFFVVLAGFVLTPKQALLSMVCYVVLGLVGAPIFAGFTGGPSSLASPTFGFLIGMIACAPLTSLLLRTLKGKMPYVPAALIAGLAGLAVTYLLGAVYGYFVMRLVLTKEVTLWFIVWNWCLVYLPVDAVKLAAALAISPVLNRAIAKTTKSA